MALDQNGGWDQLITNFERDAWPAMQAHGFRKDNAFHAFMLNRVANLLHEALTVDMTDDEAESWQQ